MERLGERDSTFDAIVTDLQMPRLGGRAMYEQLVNSRPLVAKRFVFVTGDQARGETRAFLENCGQPSVTKPYALCDLIHAIGTVSRKKETCCLCCVCQLGAWTCGPLSSRSPPI